MGKTQAEYQREYRVRKAQKDAQRIKDLEDKLAARSNPEEALETINCYLHDKTLAQSRKVALIGEVVTTYYGTWQDETNG